MTHKNWNKKDIGKILVYFENFENRKKVAISKIYNNSSNILGAVNYPINLNSKISLLKVEKNQEKLEISSLEKLGDWYFEKNVSKDEKQELNRISANF